MIKVKSFMVFNNLQEFDQDVEKFLSENNILEGDIISVIPLYGQNMLGYQPVAGIVLFYKTKE